MGLMKTIRLRFSCDLERVRNSSPSSGMRPSSGTRASVASAESEIMPPSTSQSPSLINTVVLMVLSLVTRPAAPAVSAFSTSELSTWILSETRSPLVMRGVTVNSVPTSSRLIVWKALVVPVLPVYWPVMNGTSRATVILVSMVVRGHDLRRGHDVVARVAL